VNNGATPNAPATSRVPALEGHFDPGFRSLDMDYSDLRRAERFISELRRFEQEGEMPRLIILRLPNDHTAGTSVGKLTPTAYLAENDLAFGHIIEAISHSRSWPQTAVFVVEDHAQNGPDHVDAHRTIAYLISAYARRRTVDSTLYSTASMLRTIELILGLDPMSQFDAAAHPMLACFQAEPELRPYHALPARVDLDARNGQTAWGAEHAQEMDFSREDADDDLLLNELIWRSVRGFDLSNHGEGDRPRRGVNLVAEGCGTLTNLLVAGLFIHDVNGTQRQKDNGGILFRTQGRQVPSRYDGLRLGRNIIWRVDRSGIAAQSYHASRTRWFPSTNVVIRDNRVGDVGGDGIVPWATDGCLVEQHQPSRPRPDLPCERRRADPGARQRGVHRAGPRRASGAADRLERLGQGPRVPQ